MSRTEDGIQRVANSLAHELRAPLRAILGYSGAIEKECAAALSDEGRQLFGIVQQEAQRMEELVDAMVTFCDFAGAVVHPSWVDMTAVVREVCADRAQTSASNTQFSVGSLPESLCDGVLLRCVWEQLVDNAVKFSSERAEATVTIDGRIEGARAIYRVEDNGAGFDMQYYDRLFCLFGRLHGSDRFAGTGVGLAIVERALSRHGGSVWAQSNPNAGATFFFALPAARGKNAPENYR